MTAFFVGVLALAAFSMAVYGLVGSGRDEDAEHRGSRFLLGFGDFLLHWFLWALRPVEAVFVRLGVSPHVFNFVGLALGLVSGLLVGFGRLELGGWAVFLGGVCDVVDGRVARATHVVSLYGKFIDSTLDRFVEVFVFLGFVAYFRHTALGSFVSAAALGGSLLVSYAQSRGETVGVMGSGGLMQRAERMSLTCLACLGDPPLTRYWGEPEGTLVVWALGIVAVGAFGTAVHRTIWITRRLRDPRRPALASEPPRRDEAAPAETPTPGS